MKRRITASAIAVAGLATALLGPGTGSAQAATCQAAYTKINFDGQTAAADLVVFCPKGTAWVKMHHPTSSDGPCEGYDSGSDAVATFHYSFKPSVTWTPVGTKWTVTYCSDSGSATLKKYPATGGGGSW